jgi:hypothetical protein
VFRGELPAWLSSLIQRFILFGHDKVDFTFEYLLRWGLNEVMWSIIAGTSLIGAGFYGLLLLRGGFARWIHIREWRRRHAAKHPPKPRIALKRPLAFKLPDGQGNQHRYEIHIDLMIASYADVQYVIAGLSTLLGGLTNVGRAVIKGAVTAVSAHEMQRALTHAARKATEKRVSRVELRGTNYSLVDPTGKVLYSQGPPSAGGAAAAAAPAEAPAAA